MSSKERSSKKDQRAPRSSEDPEGSEKQGEAKKPDLYVVARIISVLKEKGSINRTALATSTGLAYNRLTDYLAWMNDREFVVVNDDGLVSLTKTGIETYDELVRWILRYVGRLKFPRID